MKEYFDKMKGQGKLPSRRSALEIASSVLASFCGIVIIPCLTMGLDLMSADKLFLVGSFGATAVLLYAAPTSPLSQPRNLIGGHVISALIGVFCYRAFINYPMLAPAIAVSLSILAMQLTCTVHPPGGATAIIAVLGSDRIHDLGYSYAFFPILTGAILMLLVALLSNNIGKGRRYPLYW